MRNMKPVIAVSGVHALWLVFEGEGKELFRLDGFEFNNQ